MKTLYLLRHAKSSWDDAALEDHDRPINARGAEAAARMGQHMRKAGYAPALVLCSSARRTRETLERIEPFLPPDLSIRIEPALYLASAQRMLSVLRETDDAVPSVLVIAHSPATEQCALALARRESDGTEEALRARIQEKFPTAALAVLELPAARWRAVQPGSSRLADFVRPRDL